MRSKRLPGKVMRRILGRSMLELMIERLRRVSLIDEIVVATTSDPSCQPIADLASQVGVSCYRGSENDVLDRVLQAARSVRADVIVETTGDCPVIDPEVVDRVIKVYQSGRVDYCSNILERTYPRGMDTQVFSVAVLEEVSRLTDDPVDHEHVSLYIYNHPEIFRLLNVRSNLPPAAAELRLTVDTFEDFELITQIYERLHSVKPAFGLSDILTLFGSEPQLPLINRNVQQQSICNALVKVNAA